MSGTQEPLGSATEEAARLMAAVQDWARRNGLRGEAGGRFAAAGSPDPGAGSTPGHEPGWADGSAACRLCPLCQVIALAREASPEVIDHLGAAADSLFAAARAAMVAHDRHQRGSGDHVEWIDIG